MNENDGVVMAIFAHPDDETLVGPILNQYASRGKEVILVTATDGRLGFTDFAGYEDSDDLAAVRRKELQCAADHLGAELIHLDYEDQLGISEGHGNLVSQSRGILRDLHQIIEERKPDVIMTFGPDGYSNHMDHRIVGLSVTQVLLSREWDKKPSLFYVGIPASNLDEENRIYMGTDDSYLTVQMPYTDEELRVAERAALCHESQFTPEFVQQWFDTMQEWGNVIHFRPFETPQSASNDLFDY
jgi:LmbE family N-acetylglucosaminyl deacetylase